MLKSIKYFLPTYKQCWIIVLYICVVGGLGLGLLMMLAASLLGMALTDINPLVSYLVPLVPAFLYIVYKGNKVAQNNIIAAERGRNHEIVEPVPVNSPHWGDANPMVATLLLIVATLCSMIVLEPVSALFPMPESVKEIYRQMLDNRLWISLSVVVAAPLAEEFLLRGVMLRGLLKHTSPLVAIIYSALFFALIHMNLYQALPAFLIGVFMGWVYYKSGSLWLTILIHFVNNGTSTLFTLLFPQEAVDKTMMEMITEYAGREPYIALYVISFICLGGIIYYLHKKLNHEQDKKTISI